LDDLAGGGVALAGSVLSDPMKVVDNEGTKTLLIETGDPFSVTVAFELTGFLVPFISGTWTVVLYSANIDGMGTKVGKLGTQQVPAPGGTPGPADFSATFLVPTAPGDAGIYNLVARIGFSPTGAPVGQGSEMAGFVESPPIEIQDTVLDTN
jgi:hypothetical protein